MFSLRTGLLAASLLLCSSPVHGCSRPARGWPNPEPLKGTIPHNANATLDPSLMRRKSDGKLFLYTTGSTKDGKRGGDVFTADSLYGPWTQTVKPAIQEWCGAPTLFEKDDRYYMFYSQSFDWPSLGYTTPNASSTAHNRALFVRNSTTLEAMSWGDEPNGTRLKIDWSQDYNQLDISVLLTEGGDYLASWGSYQQGIYQMPLASSLDAVINGSGATDHNMNGNNINHLALNSSWITYPLNDWDCIEASFQFYWDDYYYLFFSSGHAQAFSANGGHEWSHAGDVYKVMVCRSEKATGPFVDADGTSCLESGGTEILATHGRIWAPGGQGVVNDTEAGGPIIYYHYVLRDDTDGPPVGGGYNFGWNKLDFSSGWPSLVHPS